MINPSDWDKTTLALTLSASFLSGHLETINLGFAILLKLATIINIVAYLIINWRRIYLAFKKMITKRHKNKKNG